MKIQKSIEINAAPDNVWPHLVDPGKIVGWFTLLKKFEFTGAKKRGVGAAVYYEEKSGPMLMKLHYAITEWVTNQRLVLVLTSGPLKKDDQIWSLEAIPSGSRFTMTEDFEVFRGRLGNVVNQLLAGGVGKNIEKILGNLKNNVEQQNQSAS